MKMGWIVVFFLLCCQGALSTDGFVDAASNIGEDVDTNSSSGDTSMAQVLSVLESLEESLDALFSFEDRIFAEMRKVEDRLKQRLDSVNNRLLLIGNKNVQYGSNATEIFVENIKGEMTAAVEESFEERFESMSRRQIDTTSLIKGGFDLQTQILSSVNQACSSGGHASGGDGSGGSATITECVYHNNTDNDMSLPQYTVITPYAGDVIDQPFLCDVTTDGGGWIVIQRRVGGDVDFERSWTDYKAGFGKLEGDFWMGNEQIHNITTSGEYELRIDLGVEDGKFASASYNNFYIDSESGNYTLHVGNFTGGIAGDSFSHLSGNAFTTMGMLRSEICNTKIMYGGWWWDNYVCWYTHSNLNNKKYKNTIGVWYTLLAAKYFDSYSTSMKIRKMGE